MKLAIDSQILNNFLACNRKMKYYNLQHLRPKSKAPALTKGALAHEIMRGYYLARKNGERDHKICFEAGKEKALKHLETEKPDLSKDEIISVFGACKENLDHHQNDGWRPIAVEETFSRELAIVEGPFTFISDGVEHTGDVETVETIELFYEGIIDLVVDAPHIGIIAIDHKTSSRNYKISSLSNQFMGYCWALGINHFIVNKIGFQTSLSPAEKHARDLKSYPDALINEWENETVNASIAIVNALTTGTFPPNYTSCDKYSGCIFQTLCSATPDAREFLSKREYVIGEKWDPMKRDAE